MKKTVYRILEGIKTKLILGALVLLQSSAFSQGAGGTAIQAKTTALMATVTGILNVILPVVAAGAFVYMVVGIFTKAQDVKTRVVYFIIGAVLMGMQTTLLGYLQTL